MDQERRKALGDLLAQLLADTYLLYTKTQNFHWNVVSPRFHSLHALFEEEYEELAEAVDAIAEQIRIVEQSAPGSFAEFLKLTRLTESSGEKSADDMIRAALHDHESLSQWLREAIEKAQELGDEGTVDLLIERLRAHTKAAWMLRSHFK